MGVNSNLIVLINPLLPQTLETIAAIAGYAFILYALSGLQAIANLDLGYSPATKVLAAQPNNIQDTGAEAIAHFLTHNQTLLKLNLRGCKISDRGLEAIFTALESNQKLCYLILDGRIKPQIEALLERNRKLNWDELRQPRSISLIKSVYR